ncbi:MAG: LamG domain-containing protein, partial [Alphaproteobacteria bacterium]|nr:LamG domain-containing protein [Alphaproteobacteria bacterium]
ANLARVRVHYVLPTLPKPDEWVHFAFTWDQTSGVTLYVNGQPVGSAPASGEWSSGLDQFGFAMRTVSPHQVQSRFNFMRGGDFANLKIYDHALGAAQIVGTAPVQAAAPLSLNDPAFRALWLKRYGWNRAGDLPVMLDTPSTSIRKVEFADEKDMKAWMYKATDGIAETTWPGVYNRSRLPGRNDYFPLPDWNVYVEGGKALTLTLPHEPWNHLEVQGAAYGALTYKSAPGGIAVHLADRAKDQERTFNNFPTHTGGILTFTNIAQETPIQEIAAYNITAAAPPEGSMQLRYTIQPAVAPDSPDLDTLNHFITGRYPPEARSTIVALPEGAARRARTDTATTALPLLHILIPYEFGAAPPDVPLARSWNYGWENAHDALDGIALDLPPLKVTPTQNGLVLLNIQVKDPIWPMRDLMDISVAVKPGEAHTLWLDTRDRILPNASLYLTIASASPDFNAAALNGAGVRLIFKDRAAGLPEHIADRLNEVRDNWGYLVEEHTASKREALYRRLVADATDLFRVDPDNKLGRAYWADIMYNNQGSLPYTQPQPPKGVPLWAFRQLEDLKNVRHFVNWWIDNRQVPYGDLGGGLSDDTDLLEQWPGLALMGVDPAKITASHDAMVEAVYKNGMFTNGLPTLALDELHAYEDGVNADSEAMYLHWGNPKQVERLMTTVAALKRIIMPNAAGHLHFATNWYSGSHAYREGPWEWGKFYSYLEVHPGVLMGYYNADPEGRR